MNFAIRAIGPNGVETLHIEAATQEEVSRQLAARNLRALSVRGADKSAWRQWIARSAKQASFDLPLFSQELLALLEAGLTLTESLDALYEKERRPAVIAILAGLRGRLAEGQRFAAALSAQPDVFPPLYCGLMRAAERTASLDNSLARYVEYRSRVDHVRRHLTQAMIYPAILCGMGFLVSLFLLGYVVPSFSSVYQSSGRDIPLASRLLMHWGRFVAENTRLIGAVSLSAGVSLIWFMRKPQTRTLLRARLVDTLRRLPQIGERLKTFELARLYLALGTLLEGGLPILVSLDLCDGLVSAKTQLALQHAMRRIGDGQPASTAFDEAGLCTPVALRLMRVGERTGQLGDMLARAARFHDGETERFIARFTRSFEPLLMAAIGIVVGVIVVLLYMPIFDLAGSFQ
ncbi:MAG TPA: type II secretion system F family protein [Pseudomonas sp.]|nr:type II secretion system F family protein [Pseudomonas sp.]